MKWTFPPLAALALAACTTVPAANAGPTALLGQTASVGGLQVRPVAVIEDSRCPIDVQCVWAGRLILRTEIRSAAAPAATRDLTLGEAQSVGGGMLTLVAADPPKLAGSAPPSPTRYTFAFDRAR